MFCFKATVLTCFLFFFSCCFLSIFSLFVWEHHCGNKQIKNHWNQKSVFCSYHLNIPLTNGLFFSSLKHSHINPIALRIAKTQWNFGHSACSWVTQWLFIEHQVTFQFMIIHGFLWYILCLDVDWSIVE